jgi:hypothetical protein
MMSDIYKMAWKLETFAAHSPFFKKLLDARLMFDPNKRRAAQPFGHNRILE